MRGNPTPLSEAARPFPGAALLLAIPALLIFALPALPSLLEYDRAALAAGELWRFVSCHWTHWDSGHLLWDLLTFVGLAALCETLDRRRLLLTLAAASLLIPAVVWAVLPEIGAYRGLSGLDAALFALYVGLVRARLRSQGRSGALPLAALALLAAKVLYETFTGETLFLASSEPGPVAVPMAQWVGGVIGWLGSGWPATSGPAKEPLKVELRELRSIAWPAGRGDAAGSADL